MSTYCHFRFPKMKYTFVLFLFIYIILKTNQAKHTLTKEERIELNKQHRNQICCAKRMKCCIKPKVSPIEMRAILTKCPRTHSLGMQAMHSNNDQGEITDEAFSQEKLTNCRRKVLLTLKLRSQTNMDTKLHFVIVDHVYDLATKKNVRLLNPYVIKMKSSQMTKSYALLLKDYVNSRAREQIYNKQISNYTGCYTNPQHSTCGIVKFEGKIVPYSEGFCCSCSAKINEERQPYSEITQNSNLNFQEDSNILYTTDSNTNFAETTSGIVVEETNNTTIYKNNFPPSTIKETTIHKMTDAKEIFLHKKHLIQENHFPKTTNFEKVYSSKLHRKNLFDEDRNIDRYSRKLKKNLHRKKHKHHLRKRQGIFQEPQKEEKYYLENVNKHQKKKHREEYMNEIKKLHLINQDLIRKIRQISPTGTQIRGNQNCASKYTPNGLDPEHYHESTHCLRFSNSWHGIYELGNAFVRAETAINIYERDFIVGEGKWHEITNGTIYMDGSNSEYLDEFLSIQTRSKLLENPGTSFSSLSGKFILIPERKKDNCANSDVNIDVEEFLVVPPDMIALEGDQCDKIGVGFEAFFKQPNRCGKPKGTCLKHQPQQLWENDKRKENRGEKGCYFLKYYINLTDTSYIDDINSGKKFLNEEYHGEHSVDFDIEINADQNIIVRSLPSAVITEVYIDSTCDTVTILTVKVTNKGISSGKYMIQLTDFPLDIPETLNNLKSKMVSIAPQNQYIFTLEVRLKIVISEIYCSVEVLNENKDLVALRRVILQKNDRCICAWHCSCTCLLSENGLKCSSITLRQYHAAGFLGGLPTITSNSHYTLFDDILSALFFFSLLLLTLLIILGFVKGLIGFFNLWIGMFGLDIILDLPKNIFKYYEKSLSNFEVEYDEAGFPIHPKTKKRVRCISRTTQFCTNVLFFILYPIAYFLLIVKLVCSSDIARDIEKRRQRRDEMKRNDYDDKNNRKRKKEKGRKEKCTDMGSENQVHKKIRKESRRKVEKKSKRKKCICSQTERTPLVIKEEETQTQTTDDQSSEDITQTMTVGLGNTTDEETDGPHSTLGVRPIYCDEHITNYMYNFQMTPRKNDKKTTLYFQRPKSL